MVFPKCQDLRPIILINAISGIMKGNNIDYINMLKLI